MKLKLTDEPIETSVDDATDAQETEQPKRVKPTSIYAAVAAFVAAIAVVALFLWPKLETKPVEQTTVEQTTVVPVTTVETTTVASETSTSAKAIEDAKDTLERPTDVATEEDAIESMLKFAQEGFKGDAYAHHSRYMDVTYVNMLKHIVQGKYTLNPSSIVVTNSEHNNVLQFAFDMTDENGNTVAFAGNYRKFDTQIQLENIKGFNPTGSAVSDKQFDPDKAGFHE